MDHTAATRIFALSLCTITLPCLSQDTSHPTTPPAANFAGCVQRSTVDKSTVILSGETVCAKLTGTFSSEKLLGHEVDLKGVLTERTAASPASIHVGSINSVGKSCSNTCSLQPPGTRGLRGGEKPGKEGGTPGMAPKTPPNSIP
jgi:hypothetical protein